MHVVGEFLAELKVRPDVILTSPLPRATQTADIAGEHLKVRAREEKLLAPGFRVEDLTRLLRKYPQQVLMLVGHEPDCPNDHGPDQWCFPCHAHRYTRVECRLRLGEIPNLRGRGYFTPRSVKLLLCIFVTDHTRPLRARRLTTCVTPRSHESSAKPKLPRATQKAAAQSRTSGWTRFEGIAAGVSKERCVSDRSAAFSSGQQ